MKGIFNILYYCKYHDKPCSDKLGYYSDMMFKTSYEAQRVLEKMREHIDRFGLVTEADMYEIAYIKCEMTSYYFGWLDLKHACVSCMKGKYTIMLPEPVDLDKHIGCDFGSGSDFDGDICYKPETTDKPILIEEGFYSDSDMELIRELFDIPDEATDIRINNIDVEYNLPEKDTKKEKIQSIIDQIHDNDVEKEVFEYLSGWMTDVVKDLEEELKIVEGEY